MPTVLLCSDAPILAEGLARILEGVQGLDLCSYCSEMEDLESEMDVRQPDILLLDLTSDIHFSALVRLHETGMQARVVLWVNTISTELAMQAMSVGVRGILRKSLTPDKLVRCLTRVMEGELWFEKALTDSLMSAQRYKLTRREGQLVSLLSQGLKNKEIATALHISEGTVKVYLSRLFQKLGVKDRFELALYGLKNLTAGTGNLEAVTHSRAYAASTPRSFFVERIPPQSQRQSGRMASRYATGH